MTRVTEQRLRKKTPEEVRRQAEMMWTWCGMADHSRCGQWCP